MMTSATDGPSRRVVHDPAPDPRPMTPDNPRKPDAGVDARHRAARRTALIFGAVALAFYIAFVLRMTVWK